MAFLSRIVREPLVHFIIIGVVIFGVYAMVENGADHPRDTIVVTEGRVQQLAQVFAKRPGSGLPQLRRCTVS